jgi:hypothetical protein
MGTADPVQSGTIATPPAAALDDSAECARVLEAVGAFASVLTIKLYRLSLALAPPVPIVPCLDHEAMLHETVAPHAAAYVQDHLSEGLHELVIVPSSRTLVIDTVSAWGEYTPDAHERLRQRLALACAGYRLEVRDPSWWRGDRRVAAACRSHVALRDVLLSDDLAAVQKGIERLRIISTLMEKESRVASWGARTITGPILATAAFVSFLLLGQLGPRFGETPVSWLRYGLIGLLGGVFLYYGLKAVQLTGMANRVWKRSAEYGLILAERRRLGGGGTLR